MVDPMKKALLIASILILVGVSLSGCSALVNGGNQSTPVPDKPALPLLDTQVNGSIETAYFALG